MVDVMKEANRAQMAEGREDRTQIEDVITIPKTDHKVDVIHVKFTKPRRLRSYP